MHELAAGVVERVATTETPRPLLAVARRRTTMLDALGTPTFLVVADRLADPGNAGTILRSAEAAGADAVVFTMGAVDPFNPKVVRAAAGATFHVPIVEGVGLKEFAGRGLWRYGTSSHHGTVYDEADYTRPCVIIVGNEAPGLAPDAPVEEWVRIPHMGSAESLNVAMATTIVCFEVARQRRRGG